MVTSKIFEPEFGALHAEIRAFRGDMRAEIEAFRVDMRAEIGALRIKIAKVPFRTAIWLWAVISIGSAIATTIYRLWFG